MRVIEAITQTIVVVVILCLILYRLIRKSNRYIIIFLFLLEVSCSLEFFAQFAELNTSSIDLIIYFYGGKDKKKLKEFGITYTYIGYLYYTS